MAISPYEIQWSIRCLFTSAAFDAMRPNTNWRQPVVLVAKIRVRLEILRLLRRWNADRVADNWLSHAYAANVRTYTVVRINRAAITIMAILAETTHYNILSYLKNEPIAKRNTVIPKSKVIAFA